LLVFNLIMMVVQLLQMVNELVDDIQFSLWPKVIFVGNHIRSAYIGCEESYSNIACHTAD